MVSFLTFGGYGFLRLLVKDSYVWRIRIVTFGVYFHYVWGLVFLRFGARDSYVCGLVFLRLLVRDSYVCRLGILTFGGYFSYI